MTRLDTLWYAQVGIASRLACYAHAGQTDKAGRAYISHPLRVAAAVSDDSEEMIAIALLHDTLEDSDLTAEDLHERGVKEIIVKAVVALTHEDNEPYEDYIKRVAKNERAHIVKLADIADNTDPHRLAALDPATHDRLIKKYDGALRILSGRALADTRRKMQV